MADTMEHEPLAIVGLAFRFPDEADTSEGFWSMLEERRCVMSEIPPDRININAFYHNDTGRTDTLNMKGGHFMKGQLGAFDNAFFSIGPLEAGAMDPQQRGMLETSYHALENAGLPLKAVAGSKTAVFTASFSDDHRMLSLKDPELLSAYAGSSTAWSILANRLSWWYDLKGPSVHVDTACSSGLVALHLACQSLRNGESSMALVGGSNVLSSVEQYLLMSNLGMLSPHSRSYSFDHRANGYARGEGFGFVVVKKLSDALANGDTIRAVIRATGVNQDGRTPSLTSPAQEAQETLIRDTYRAAGLNPKDTTFVEAHGTGTPVGDPIEARALASVFGAGRPAGDPVYIGAVKSNIGHLEGASGLAGLIKTILLLEKAVIPPNANFEKINPSIDATALNIKFPTEPTPWPSSGIRRASVNSFGFGGTNAHVVLDDAFNFLRTHNMTGHHLSVATVSAPSTESQPGSRAVTPLTPSSWEDLGTGCSQPLPKLLTWSASDEKGTQRLTKALEQYFVKNARENYSLYALDAIAYTLSERRTLLNSRSFAVIDNQSDVSQLSKLASAPVKSKQPRSICFVFTGQGAQYSQMGLQLIQYPAFRKSIETSEACLRNFGCKWSLLEEISKPESESRVNEPELSQPLCTALQVALVDQLASFGITPSVVVGHSSGEIAAAYAMGALSATAAVKVAYLRGKVAEKLTKAPTRGSMMAVGLSDTNASVYIDRYKQKNPSAHIGIACHNSPSSVTLAGDCGAIEAIRMQMEEDGMFARKLKIPVAYHSPHVQQVSPHYRALLKDLDTKGRQIDYHCTMFSSVTGQSLKRSQATDPEYWVKNLESPVRFNQALSEAIRSHAINNDVTASSEPLDLLEIGPHCALKGPVKNIIAAFPGATFLRYDTVMDRQSPPAHVFLGALGRLHCLGQPVDLLAVNGLGQSSRRELQIASDLPAYPFDHSTAHWHKSRKERQLAMRKEPRLDLLGLKMIVDGPPQLTQRWRKFTKISETPWVRDHVVSGTVIYPAAGMICMAIEAAKQIADVKRKVKAYRLTDVELHRALEVPEGSDGVESQLELTPVPRKTKHTSEFQFSLCSFQGGSWIQNCSGVIRTEYDIEGQNTCLLSSYDESICTQSADTNSLYEYFNDMGLSFGATFQSLAKVAIGNHDDACSTVDAFPWTASSSVLTQEHVLHPITLDGIFQTIMAAVVKGGKRKMPTAVPTRVDELYIDGVGAAAPKTTSLTAYAKVAEQTKVTTTSSASAWNDSGRILVSVTGLQTTFVDAAVEDDVAVEEKIEEHLCHNVVWQPDVDFLSYSQTPEQLQRSSSDELTKVQYAAFSRSFSLICAEIVRTFEFADITPSRPYLQIYYRWMEEFASKVKPGELEHAMMQDDKILGLSDKATQETVNGKGLALAEQSLRGILTGEIDPVETIFKSSWAESYYKMLNSDAQAALQHVIELISFKNPGLKVLEIGAGTGSTTAQVLKHAISRDWGFKNKISSAIKSYDFTDISPAFFSAAKEKFEGAGPSMNYAVLDVSKDPLAQGFKEDSYDLIVAANVLHATTNLNTTISNVRRLLKKGGKLVLFEITSNQWLPQIMFGTLPGWWLSEDEYRTHGPCITTDLWNKVFQKNGFSGTDIVLHDSDDLDCRMCSVIVATAIGGEVEGPAISVIVDNNNPAHLELAAELKMTLGHADVGILSLQEASSQKLSGRIIISLLELNKPFLASMQESSFNSLRDLLVKANGVIWVHNTGAASPDFHLAEGLLRVLRSEDTGKRYISYGVAADTRQSEAVRNLIRLVKDLPDEEYQQELEIQDVNGQLCIGRAMPAVDVNKHVETIVTDPSDTSIACNLDPNATYLIVGGFGGLARTICSWMTRRGARNLLLLSRSGPSSTAAKDLISKLSSQGVRVEAPACDVSDAKQVNSVITSYAKVMPTIKGCIQGALVLRDSVFERMTFEQWKTTISIRVQGTKNLKSVLPQSIDFFILLSSVNGLLGSVSQANYAASNTFLDAFAQHHSIPDFPIISIDLGWMSFAGTVAESQAITQRMKDTKCARPVAEDEMLGLLDYYCDDQRIKAVSVRHTSIGIQPQGTEEEWKRGYLDRPMWKHMLHTASIQASVLATRSSSSDATSQSTAEPETTKKRVNVSMALTNASSLQEAQQAALKGLMWKVATDLGSSEDLEPSKPLHEAGVDSLLAVQIKSWVREEMRADISVFDIMGTKSMQDLAAQIAKGSKFVKV